METMTKQERAFSKKQEEYLLEGLQGIKVGRYDWNKPDDTPEEEKVREQLSVLSAKVTAIDKTKEREVEKAINAWEKKRAQLRKIILFGPANDALAMLERLQEEYRGLRIRR